MDAIKWAKTERWQSGVLGSAIYYKNMSKLETPNIHIGLDNIATSSTTCDLGVIIDSALSMSPHMAAVCKVATFQLHCISHIHWFVTKDLTQTLVH